MILADRPRADLTFVVKKDERIQESMSHRENLPLSQSVSNVYSQDLPLLSKIYEKAIWLVKESWKSYRCVAGVVVTVHAS